MQGPFQACLTAHGDRCKLWKPSENLADGCKVGVASDVVVVMYVVAISKAELQVLHVKPTTRGAVVNFFSVQAQVLSILDFLSPGQIFYSYP